MTWLVPQLRHRFSLLAAVQTPAAGVGKFERGYLEILTFWGSLRELGPYAAYIRGQQQNVTNPTHEIAIRRQAVSDIGITSFGGGFGGTGFDARAAGLLRGYDKGFSLGFDCIVDNVPVKADWFLWQTWNGTGGRLFEVQQARDAGERREYLMITAREVEERGVGWPE